MRALAVLCVAVWTLPAAATEPDPALAERVAALGRVGSVFGGGFSADGETVAVQTGMVECAGASAAAPP